MGLYLNPPEKAIAWRRRKVLRSGPRSYPGIATDGQGPWRDDDPRLQAPRHHPLFAALDGLTGIIISQCQSRHRHQEWLKFLKTIDRQVPKDLQIHEWDIEFENGTSNLRT